jgi:uncharacterized hydantoinase/oxoprolinase family protein
MKLERKDTLYEILCRDFEDLEDAYAAKTEELDVTKKAYNKMLEQLQDQCEEWKNKYHELLLNQQ